MRTAVRLTLLCVLLSLPFVAAGARPRQSQPPARDARCKAAAHKYISVVSDKKHRTVEQQSWVEYDEGRKYLRVCGDLDDGFTRSVKTAVGSHEAARRCEAETWAQYSARVTVDASAAPALRREAYEAAKEYLRLCGRYDIQSARRAARLVEKYEAATPPPKANATAEPCDEMRRELSNPRSSAQTPERMQKKYEESKKFLRVCGGKDDRFEAFIRSWVEKYDKAVREFEEKRKAETPPAKDPTKEQPK